MRKPKMVGPSHLKPLQFLYNISVKAPQYPNPSSMKIKSIVQSHILRHVWRIVGSVTKAKSKLFEIIKEKRPDYYIESINKSIRNKKKIKRQKKLFGSITAHYNWCSSHVGPMPMSEPSMDHGFSAGHGYYDSTWNSVIPECEDGMESQLSGYLQWLEEKVPDSSAVDTEVDDEIDRLAAKFIASCHEKFRLEKQESYRRYQEMMARSM
ncbi:uncharacterized protein LOC122062002 [Macadamia integrifolia]|uniref:uncharacterized protein LOC122062002 n=1 Tax=Macadamia integrifolia TaxID=60698 RepID=UPI001C532769|nr:uncharacterized protein LOC122062002 [Macadamia integrifolia]